MALGISIGDVLKLCELAGRVYKNCRDCTGEYKSLVTEARSLTNLLEDIQDKYDKIPEIKQKQLADAYEPCIDVLQELDKLLNHYNNLDTKSKRAWDRLKWDPDKSRTLRDRLTSSVTMLNAFYTSLIHDSQVRILEALERLEQDYRGGHREESIASLERITSSTVGDEEEEDAAWTQILRDLEDVGVAKQDALGYRDMIVDWLVEAVNQGRLLEQHTESDGLLSMPCDLETALPTPDVVGIPGTHHLDVPEISPPSQGSSSAPGWSPPPLLTPSDLEDQWAHSIPSTTSLPVPELSGMSSYAASYSSDTDTDTSSLYARPPPKPKIAPTAGSSTNQIKRVPVPTRVSASSNAVAGSTLPPTYTPPSLPAPFVAPPLPVRPAPAVPQTAYVPPAPSLPTTLIAPQAPAGIQSFPTSAAPPEPLAVWESAEPSSLQTPPSYYDKSSSITADLAWTALQILAAWSRRDFMSADKYLEEQLAAVERGQTVLTTGAQPDCRILRYLIGVCSSYIGNFQKAKRYFESVFNGIYLDRANFDDGDIAAARWLGDVCLHLREHQNCVLAWSIAYEGSIGRYGIARDRTQQVAKELRLLDRGLFAFRRIEKSFLNNVDPTNIFRGTQAVEKSNLIASVKARLYDGHGLGENRNAPPMYPYNVTGRPKTEALVSEGFLLGPLISLSAWPLQWDSTFSPSDAVQLDRCMNTVRIADVITPLVKRSLPTTGLGDSKKLHYVTKRGGQWLIEAVKKGLHEICIEHAEQADEPTIVCCLNQHRDGYAFSEGVEICFKKLQFRNVHGLKITNVKWATRTIGLKAQRNTNDFRDILKSILERTEQDAATAQFRGMGVSPPLPQPSFESYR